MLATEAATKDCPFKSTMVHEPSIIITTPGWFYCNNVSCMSWEMDQLNPLEGYCKLIEAPLPVG